MSASDAPASDWIWSRERDLAVFGGAAVFGVAVSLAVASVARGVLPSWAWLVFVLGLDVAHVWSTLFRTYLDSAELRAHPARYLGVPLACYAGGVVLYLVSAGLFWRALAYAAVFHFIRQQAGWVAIARSRARLFAAVDRRIDEAVVYLATGVPLVHWHAHQPRAFRWFVDGDFFAGPRAVAVASRMLAPLEVLYAAVAAAYLCRALVHARSGRQLWSKHLLVLTTASVWWFGIAATNDDVIFTVTNVTLHAVPYFALLWSYARARAEERPRSTLARLVGVGVLAFAAVALVSALLEEFAWDRLVWHEHEWLFGEGTLLGMGALPWVVPLLALPQATHYVLDGVLWRSREAGNAQRRALGFLGARAEFDEERSAPC